jgi:hypothetical protein
VNNNNILLHLTQNLLASLDQGLGNLNSNLGLGLSGFSAGRVGSILSLAEGFSGSGNIKVLNWGSLFSQDLHAGIIVDGDGAAGHEVTLAAAISFDDGHNTGLEHGQSGHMLGEDTEGAAEGWNVNLPYIGVVVKYLNVSIGKINN